MVRRCFEWNIQTSGCEETVFINRENRRLPPQSFRFCITYLQTECIDEHRVLYDEHAIINVFILHNNVFFSTHIYVFLRTNAEEMSWNYEHEHELS